MSTHETDVVRGIRSDYKYGFSNPDDAKDYFFKSGRGISHEVVEAISEHKAEPEWMRQFRHKSLDYFLARPMPSWGGTSPGSTSRTSTTTSGRPRSRRSRDDLPAEIKDTWDKLGIPEAEKKYLAGVGAQYESEVVYHKLQADLEAKGVIFLDMDSASVSTRSSSAVLRDDHPAERQQVRGAQLGGLVGRPVHLRAPGVKVEMPLQAYFRINAENMGQFERTLIIVDEDAYVHYVEGCTAPIYSSDSLHSAVVEIVVKRGGRHRYTTIQNWSNNVYNLVTKRAIAYEDATMEWVDGNLGSKVTMKYPAVWLMGERAHGEVLDRVRGQGPASGRGRQGRPRRPAHDLGDHVEVDLEGRRPPAIAGCCRSPRAPTVPAPRSFATRSSSTRSRARHLPVHPGGRGRRRLGHEATVSKIGEEQLFYLMSRGLSEAEASAMIVSGFVEPITKELPLEYAVEMNRLIQLQMEGSVG